MRKPNKLSMRPISKTVLIMLASIPLQAALHAQAPDQRCPRPSPGSVVTEPENLRSHNGVLEVELTLHSAKQSDGSTRYCYIDAEGKESPNLRVNPGDVVILKLKNDLVDSGPAAAAVGHQQHASTDNPRNACSAGLMTEVSTNLHFHGLTIPPVCHQDDVLQTSIQPGDPPFEYRFRIPKDEPPGLYWYHPHIHGFTKRQVLGGASGAIIVEGIERASKAVAGLPERIFIIRDQDLLNPNAPPAKWEPVVPKMLVDQDGDAANTGTGYGKPAKDLSINFVPAPYPDYPRSLRNWCGKSVLEEFLHPGVAVKTLTPKQPPFPAQRAAHQPLSRQRREAAKDHKMRLGNIRQTPVYMSAGTAEGHPKSRHDLLKWPQGLFGPRGIR